MIIVSYPVATGGSFVCSVIALILYGVSLTSINPNGGVHFSSKKILSLHESDIKLLFNTYSVSKIVCITIDQEDYDIQEKNFLKKCIPDLWSEHWYNKFKSSSYPPYNTNVFDMPEYVIQDILKINRNYIENWNYVFPNDMSNILVLNFKDIMYGNSLVDKLQIFFNIDKIDDTVYQFISDYRTLQ